jgi:AcrR family transcriptional regulator
MARTGVANPMKRSAATRADLLEAAAEVFAEKGYEGTTLAAIADRASVTTGAIYSNFHGKEDLLCEVLRARLFADRGFRNGIVATPDISPLRVALVTEPLYPNAVRMYPLLLEAFAAARRSPAVRELLSDLMADINGGMADRVRVAKQQGLIADEISAATLVWFQMAPIAMRVFTEALGLQMPAPNKLRPILERFDESLKPDSTVRRQSKQAP